MLLLEKREGVVTPALKSPGTFGADRFPQSRFSPQSWRSFPGVLWWWVGRHPTESPPPPPCWASLRPGSPPSWIWVFIDYWLLHLFILIFVFKYFIYYHIYFIYYYTTLSQPGDRPIPSPTCIFLTGRFHWASWSVSLPFQPSTAVEPVALSPPPPQRSTSFSSQELKRTSALAWQWCLWEGGAFRAPGVPLLYGVPRHTSVGCRRTSNEACHWETNIVSFPPIVYALSCWFFLRSFLFAKSLPIGERGANLDCYDYQLSLQTLWPSLLDNLNFASFSLCSSTLPKCLRYLQ